MIGFLAGFAIAWGCEVIDRIKRGAIWYDNKVRDYKGFIPPPKPY